jgi:hypothetical protein
MRITLIRTEAAGFYEFIWSFPSLVAPMVWVGAG